ncbi:SDR family oxidoreductase [Actinocorallia sp. B10E7]|uniref:SDR family NAD(P)-dependent oxidoreductase n=1 Tax=Actinocorallia sp. B10E7 TaxID=3153558 RepID=UPI00325EBD60
MKVAVVTGAAGSIGAAVCLRLVERGFRVFAVDVDEEGLARLPEAVTAVRCDLTDLASYDLVASVVKEGAGRCDVLVNNAGIVVTTPFEEATAQELLREQQLNLQAPMLLTRALFPLLQEARGQVVSVVSLGALLPLAQSPGYSASKFGLRGFLLGLAMREKETGVGVSIVNPSAVDTPMLRHEAATGGSPLNFLGRPMEAGAVAEVVVGRLRRPRLETNLPASDGWLVKTAMLFPALVRRARPVLEWVARPALRKYQRRHGIS